MLFCIYFFVGGRGVFLLGVMVSILHLCLPSSLFFLLYCWGGLGFVGVIFFEGFGSFFSIGLFVFLLVWFILVGFFLKLFINFYLVGCFVILVSFCFFLFMVFIYNLYSFEM